MDFESSERLVEIKDKIKFSTNILDWVDENIQAGKKKIKSLEKSIKCYKKQMSNTVAHLALATDEKVNKFYLKSYKDYEEILTHQERKLKEESNMLNQMLELHPKHIKHIHELIMEREREKIYSKGE